MAKFGAALEKFGTGFGKTLQSLAKFGFLSPSTETYQDVTGDWGRSSAILAAAGPSLSLNALLRVNPFHAIVAQGLGGFEGSG